MRFGAARRGAAKNRFLSLSLISSQKKREKYLSRLLGGPATRPVPGGS
jgi:hypothetical protein